MIASMPAPSPRTTLLLLLALAGTILAAGLQLGRVTETVRVDREREALRRFASEMQAELQRLDALYEDHLTRLARTVPPNDAFEIRRAADRIVGIRQFSLLHRAEDRTVDLHVPVASMPGERTPVPAVASARVTSASTPLLVDEEKLFNGASSSGWIDEPGKPLLFWRRLSSTQIAALIIDVPAVEAAIDQWFAAWAADRFAPVRAGGGPDQLRTRSGHPLLAEGRPGDARPDLLLPLRSRLGTWDLASWDRRETRVHFDATTLAVTGALAVFLALLGVAIAAQQRRALALAAQRVSFVNRVSHELRAPLTNILLNVDLAAETLEDTPREAGQRLALVQEEARRLSRLITNVLTFSRSEQGALRVAARACVPANVIAAVVAQFEPGFARRSIIVRRTDDASAACTVDADALAQILGNLLSNVEKYVPGGVVEIASVLADGVLTIRVSDSGPGIPAESSERIFHPFERLESRINEGGTGTGLGLAIARDLASRMGGSLRLLPSTRGAAFELRVPAPEAPPLSAVA